MPDRRKILIVDDSIAIVNSLEAILGVSGYQVETAYNGSDALRKIHQNNYDLVICDIEMPGISGLEFLSRVREDFDDNLDVILMTGYLEHDYFIEAIRLGASDFIRKPIDTKQMINSIRELLFRKRSRDDVSEFYCHLDKASFSFDISAEHFSKFTISKIFSSYLRQYFKIDPMVLNELLICVDEMVYNAYIHGTLELSIRERALTQEELHLVIDEKLQDPKIAKRKMHLVFEIDNEQQMIEIGVSDDGNGFDYPSWINTVQTEQILDIKEHGRGIAMLYHLSDELSFDNEGKSVKIRKSLNMPVRNENR
ncbi:MAG: response regulator [Candidatus Cloacimonadaceae bacterium]|jgi:DNA-binding response OmpR family regulator|nr:response regulator [Candidatus Cloacimonadota bacterium]MDY0127713.1 response regulator [Candidatus Cloacimonadaceae bacterium]MCB5254900.1 response regulator [Candidatus Cloacimonadota bacterium]MCK9177760.1 response regulator [Candidatus Cloacimonadota bacterium]MCK9242235.1 response regulator [Candidatus Cloacimonadota bacterium]